MSKSHGRLNSRRWAWVRRQAFRRDGYRCRSCGKASRLECDHVVPLHVDPDQDPYDPDGCQTLCRRCHIAKTRAENTRPVTPEQIKWRNVVEELLGKERIM